MASLRPGWHWRALCAAGLLALVGFVCRREFAFFVAPDPEVLLEIRDDIRNVEDLAQWPAGHGRFENHGFIPCRSGAFVDSGWCLPPHHSGALRFLLPDEPRSQALLARLVFFRKHPSASSRLLVFREGEATPRLTYTGVHFVETRLDLSSVLSGPGGRVVLQFEGDNPTDEPDVLLQYFDFRLFAEPLSSVPSLSRMILAIALLGLAWLPLIRWRTLLPLWAILTVGFGLRYYALQQVLYLPPDLDAWGYQELARTMRLFSDTGFFSARFGNREPLFLLILKGALVLLGDSQTHVRLVSLFASLAVILLGYRVGAKLFSRPLGLLAALAFAINLPLVRESVRGLRLETELILLLLFIEAAFLAKFRSVWVRAGLCGLLGGALALLRTNYLVNLTVPLVAAFAPWQRRAGWAAALALALMVGLYLPHRWNGHRLHGDWTWDNNARYWANIEFAGRPGWPSKAEMWRNTEGTGPKMTAFDYFFGLHTMPEFMAGNLRGLSKIVGHMEVIAFHRTVARMTKLDTRWLDWGFQLFGLIGLLMAAWIPGRRWLPLMFLCLLVHVAFVYDRGAVEPWRHTYQAFPVFLFGALVALSRLTGAFQHLRRVS